MPHDVSTGTVLQGWHPSEMTTWRPKLKMQGYLGVLNRAVPIFLFRAVPEKITLMCFVYQLLHLSWKIQIAPPCHWNPSTGAFPGSARPLQVLCLFSLVASWLPALCWVLVFFWRQSTQKKVKRGIFAKVSTSTTVIRHGLQLENGTVGEPQGWKVGCINQVFVLNSTGPEIQISSMSCQMVCDFWGGSCCTRLYKCHYAWE